MELLSILETATGEIRGMQEQLRSYRAHIANLTLRLAISQMRGNRIDYAIRTAAEDAQWKQMNTLIDEGRLALTYSGEVMLDWQPLDRRLMESAMPATKQTVESQSGKPEQD